MPRVGRDGSPSGLAFRIRPRFATFPGMRVSVARINVGAALHVLWLLVLEIVTDVIRMDPSPSVAR